jgi:competence protein ComEC
MLRAGTAILAGAVWSSLLPQNIDGFWISFLPVCLFLAITSFRWRWLWLFAASMLWTALQIQWQLQQRLPDEWNNKRLTLFGEVLTIPKLSSGNASFLFRPDATITHAQNAPGLIKLYWRNAPLELSAGQTWKLRVKVKQPHGYQNPGGFDYERWMFVKGIDATGYVVDFDGNRLIAEASWSVNNWRQQINRHIASLCIDCRNLGLMQALATGFRGNIDPAQRKLIQQTGTAHLIAISGLHIGVIAGVFFLLGRLLWCCCFYRWTLNRREFALLFSWLAAVCYALLAGFDLPAQRALIMLTTVFAALWLRNPVNLFNSVALAMSLILIISPLSVLSVSFWLSFSAMLVIMFGLTFMPKWNSRVARLVVMQLLFSLLFAPLSLIIFGQLQLSSLLANLIAVPVVSFLIVPVDFLLTGLWWLPKNWLEFLYSGLDGLLDLLLLYLQWLQEVGLQARAMDYLNGWQLLAILILIILLLLPRGMFARHYAVFMLSLLIAWPEITAPQPVFKLAVLDVGMGLSVVVQTSQHSLVYDVGPGNRRGWSLGQWVLIPYLHRQGITSIDRMVISHVDQDHMGGLYAIYPQLDYGLLSSGTPQQLLQKIPQLPAPVNCHRLPDWWWDGVHFSFLTSYPDMAQDDNNRSCVLKIDTPQMTILLPGDIEVKQEQKLVDRYGDGLAADILVAPHHGSLTSSSDAFVHSVHPRHVVFTSGFLNRWGFPKAENVKKYRQEGSRLYNTATDGAILLDCSSNGCEIHRYRRLHPRLWY